MQVVSLCCWGGKVGFEARFTAPYQVAFYDGGSLTIHGTQNNGAGIVFSTTGALPSPLVAGTTYYPRAVNNLYVNLYDTQAHAIAGGSTGLITLSGAGTGTHTAKSAWFLGLSDYSRWGGVNGRIYKGFNDVKTQRDALATTTDVELIEFGEAYKEWKDYANINPRLGKAPRTIYTSSINGVRTAAFHNGNINADGTGTGFVYLNPNYGFTLGFKTDIDGITMQFYSAGTGAGHISTGGGSNNKIQNCIFLGNGTPAGTGLTVQSGTNDIQRNLFVGLAYGIQHYDSQGAGTIANNTVTKCTNGIASAYDGLDYRLSSWINNICVGNTTNWRVRPNTLELATHNVGVSGDSPWTTTGGVSYTMATSDFVDYANYNFRLKATAPVVERATDFYGLLSLDIAGSVIPSYPGANYGNTIAAGSFVTGLSYTIASVGTTDFTLIGASANTVGVKFKATGAGSGTGTATLGAVLDPGCYEADLGYGAWPAAANLTFTVKNEADVGVTGYEYRIYLKDPADGVIGTTELAGMESCPNSTQVYRFTVSASSYTLILQIIKDGYEEWLSEHLIATAVDQTVNIKLTTERNI